jgi:hypothetical protein
VKCRDMPSFAVLQEEEIIRNRPHVGYYVAFEPTMRRVQIQPGTRVYARPPTPQERADLTATPWGTPVLVVEEPGTPPDSQAVEAAAILRSGH